MGYRDGPLTGLNHATSMSPISTWCHLTSTCMLRPKEMSAFRKIGEVREFEILACFLMTIPFWITDRLAKSAVPFLRCHFKP